MDRESNPNYRPFGESPCSLRGLSAVEQAELGPHERIAGVWPLIVRLCTSHADRLEKQGIAIAAEDLIQEFATILIERDEKWDPARGKYTTFVSCVWRNVRQRSDETRGVVPAPHNAYSTMQKLRKERDEGTITQRRLKTLYGLETVHRTELPFEETV